MKPLTAEQKEEIWKQIEDAMHHSSNPKSGEYTLTDLIKMTGLSKNRVVVRIDKLIDAEILGKRKGVSPNGVSCNIYFPIREVSVEELLEVLTS